MQFGPEWPVEYYELTLEDYIYSIVIETPQLYYIMPSKRIAYVFVIGRGMVRFLHDFREMDDEQIDRTITLVRRQL